MEGNYTFSVNGEGAKLLKRCVDLYLERWPGGDPNEQESLHELQILMNAIVLEDMFMTNGNSEQA